MEVSKRAIPEECCNAIQFFFTSQDVLLLLLYSEEEQCGRTTENGIARSVLWRSGYVCWGEELYKNEGVGKYIYSGEEVKDEEREREAR